MAISLALSSMVSNTVFLAATPELNTSFIAKMGKSPLFIFSDTNAYIAAVWRGKQSVSTYQAKRQVETSELQNKNYTAQGYHVKIDGVYEKQNVSTGTIQINITDDATYTKTRTLLAGEEIEIWTPVAVVAQ